MRWLEELLGSGQGRRTALGPAYFVRGFLAVLQADSAAARPALARAVAASREAAQPDWLAQSLSMASIAENMAGDRAAARRVLDEAGVITAGLEDLPATLMLLQARALGGLFEGDLNAVRAASSEGVRLSRDAGDLYSLGHMLLNAGLAALIVGELDASRAPLADALRVAHQIDDRVGQLYALGALGCCAAASGEPRLAAQLLGATESLRAEVGARINGIVAPLLARAQEAATAALGPGKFDAEFAAGTRYGRDDAVGRALGRPADVASEAGQEGGSGLLGKREADVAQLVAEGLSNKQIGARLFLSERTVESHVRSILNKLGVNSQAQIAGWVASSKQ